MSIDGSSDYFPASTNSNGNSRSGRSLLTRLFPSTRRCKNYIQQQQSDDPMTDLCQSPLTLSPSESAQLLGNNTGDGHGMKIGVICSGFYPSRIDVDYSTVPPVQVPTVPSEEAPSEVASSYTSENEVVWYQGYDELWRHFYYFNDKTKESQWEQPDQAFVPFPKERLATGRVVEQERSNDTTGRISTQDDGSSRPFRPLPHHSKRRSKPRSRKSRGCMRHATKQERKKELVQCLVEFTSCSTDEAKAALPACNKDVDMAAEMILKPTRSPEGTISSNSYPDEFLCSICLDVMMDPVLAADGHTYCCSCIQQWLENHSTSPKTNEPLLHKVLTPNHALRSMICSTQL